MLVLKPFQVEGVQFLRQTAHAILADDMGLGKTLQAVRAIDAVWARSVLIVCPASLKYTWYNAICAESYSIGLTPEIIQGKTRAKTTSEGFIWIVSYNYLVSNLWMFRVHSFDVLICDEAHYLRRITSRRTSAVLGQFGVATRCKYKWMLTGTPIYNRPYDLYPVLSVLFRKQLGQYWDEERFRYRYCGGSLGLGSSHENELNEKLSVIMLRRTKSEVLPELDPVTREVILLPAETAIMKDIIKKGDDIKVFPNADGTLNVAALGALAKHRKDLALAKIPSVIEEIRRILEHKQKIVIFFYHIDIMGMLRDKLEEYNPVCYWGDLTALPKERVKESFIKQKGVRIFLGQIGASGVGLDGLQTVCDTTLFVEWDWTPGGNNQAIDRVQRMGQLNPVCAIFFVIKSSWEEKMLLSVASKESSIKTIMGDSK
jgi:SNF2 family DNA or RNA helicase